MECDHRHWEVHGKDPVGKGWCQDCQKWIPIAHLLNNMALRLQQLETALERKLYGKQRPDVTAKTILGLLEMDPNLPDFPGPKTAEIQVDIQSPTGLATLEGEPHDPKTGRKKEPPKKA